MKANCKSQELHHRVLGLDSLRFVCALWVTFNHVGFGEVPLRKDVFIEWAVRGVLGSLFNSPAAVIVFFLISGFCIHLPFSKGRDLHLAAYVSRRVIRIMVPLLAIGPLGKLVGIPMTLMSQGILWSVICELVYYLLYPALRKLKTWVGWRNFILISFVGSFIVILNRKELLNYPESISTDWLLGLPCWLLGCLLAETWGGREAISKKKMWQWRLSVWAISSFTVVLRFHASLGYPITLTFFSVLAYFWLRNEIPFSQKNFPITWLEKLGQASFSLYLCHYPAAAIQEFIFPINHTHHILIDYFFVALVTIVFYFSFEKPGHRLAQWVSKRLEPSKLDSIELLSEEPKKVANI